MGADQAATVGTVLARGAGHAEGMSPQTSALDVWTHSYDGLAAGMHDFAADPAGFVRNHAEQEARLQEAMASQHWESSTAEQARASMSAQYDALAQQVGSFTAPVEEADGTTRPKTALEYVGQTFQMLTAAEQILSTVVSVIPFPAFPAVRITDRDIGLPHAHGHPPNTPPPPIPFPSMGPVIPIPFVSGAAQTLINGMPAARCGDMGLGIWCGGYFPMYEIFLGSSNVWIEGCRAARVLCDITKHCIFTTPKPSDLPLYTFLGLTVTSSPNVVIGGVPMPSLTSMAIGATIKAAFRGLKKVTGLLRPARAAAGELAVFRRGGEAAGQRPVSLRELRMKLGRAGVDTSDYAFRKATAEETALAGNHVYGWVNVDGAGRVAADARGRPIINFTDKGLSSLEEGVKTYGHEASHMKDYKAGIRVAREAMAEKAGTDLWNKVSGALERRNR